MNAKCQDADAAAAIAYFHLFQYSEKDTHSVYARKYTIMSFGA